VVVKERKFPQKDYPHSRLTGSIISAAQRVQRTLGPGFRELIYQRSLQIELLARALDSQREVWLEVYYENTKVGRKRVDFIVQDVLVEIKAKPDIEGADVIQTLSYLKASGLEVGLLINFGARLLQVKRMINR